MSPVHSIGILVGPKGRGTNLRAIVEACEEDGFPGKVQIVIAPSDTLPAVEFARNHNIPVEVITPGEAYASELVRALECCDLICLAGYMRLLPIEVLSAHPKRILNIHPALLPKFGGKGMYGMHVHRAVIDKGEPESGCTVHWVTEAYDEGEPVYQLKCPVLPQDTPEDLASRVLECEKTAYPAAIYKVLSGEAS